VIACIGTSTDIPPLLVAPSEELTSPEHTQTTSMVSSSTLCLSKYTFVSRFIFSEEIKKEKLMLWGYNDVTEL